MNTIYYSNTNSILGFEPFAFVNSLFFNIKTLWLLNNHKWFHLYPQQSA